MALVFCILKYVPRLLISSALLDDAIASGQEFDLDSDNAKKLVKVLRMTPGETFVAFNGMGREWECALTDVSSEGRARARAAIVDELDTAIVRRVHLSIAQSIPKGDKMEFVLQKGTELGATDFWPFDSDRSISRLSPDEEAERATTRAQRWRRIVEGAASQCGRADVPIVHAIADLGTVLSTGTSEGHCFFLDESETTLSLREALKQTPIPYDAQVQPRAMIVVGPEGGWTDREREEADRYGAQGVSLGSRILRTETAALVAATILSWEAGELERGGLVETPISRV